jgi:hypothetical protein
VTYKRAKEETEIKIICTQDIPLSSILHGFYTTALLNFMTWNMVYALFPQITFLEPRKTYPLHEITKKHRETLTRYADRGWCAYDTMGSPIPCLIPAMGSRQLSDSKTWKIALDITGIEASPAAVPDFVLSCTEFRIKKKPFRRLL